MGFCRAKAGSKVKGRSGSLLRREFLALSAIPASACLVAEKAMRAAPDSGSGPQRLPPADRCSGVRGVDYYPSWVRSLPDLWLHYDPERLRFELSLARALGFNTVRAWLGTMPFERLGKGMLEHVADFFTACGELGLGAIPCIFDSCGVEPSSYSGEVVRIREAYDRLMRSPRISQESRNLIRELAGAYAVAAGRDARCPYSEEDPSVLVWQWHTPSPGYSRIGREYWPALERYLRALLGRFGNHPAVLAWDLMNEPNCVRLLTVPPGGSPAFDRQAVRHFVERMREVAESVKPRKPITIGAENAQTMRDLADYAEILSFHTYEEDPQKLAAILKEERAFAGSQHKPLLLTEAVAVLFPRSTSDTGDAAQLALYRRSLPMLEQAGTGYCLVALMEGCFPWAWVGYFRPDGTRKAVADYLESVLKNAPKMGA